jgi:hypothetical protein
MVYLWSLGNAVPDERPMSFRITVEEGGYPSQHGFAIGSEAFAAYRRMIRARVDVKVIVDQRAGEPRGIARAFSGEMEPRAAPSHRKIAGGDWGSTGPFRPAESSRTEWALAPNSRPLHGANVASVIRRQMSSVRGVAAPGAMSGRSRRRPIGRDRPVRSELFAWIRLVAICVGSIALIGGIIAAMDPVLELVAFR